MAPMRFKAKSMAALHKSNKGKAAWPKAAYGVRRTMNSDGSRNEYAFVSGLYRIPVKVPEIEQRDNHATQLRASTDACAYLDELVQLSPEIRDTNRAKTARPFISISLNPTVPLDTEQRTSAWRRWEDAQGLAGTPYIEWTHGKSLDLRPEHYHRLYPRVRVDGDARIIGMSDDWRNNELASVLTSFDNRSINDVKCYPGRHAAFVYTKLASEHPEVREFFINVVRERIAETNHKRQSHGQKPLDVPKDDRAACYLFSAKCLDRRAPAFFRPNTDPARTSALAAAREIVPLLSCANGYEECRAALAGTRWRLAQGRHAPVIVCSHAPGGDATGTIYGMGALFRAYYAEINNIEPEKAHVGRWIGQRVPPGSSIPSKAEITRAADPDRDALRRQRKAITAASRAVKTIEATIRNAGVGPDAVAARMLLDDQLQEAKEARRAQRRQFNDTLALHVETSVVLDPGTAISPWVGRADGLYLSGLGKRKNDRQIRWGALAGSLRKSLKARTGGQGTITVYGGNGGVARANRLILALHAAGRPGLTIINLAQSLELQAGVRRMLVQAKNRRTAAATGAVRRENLVIAQAGAAFRQMLWSQANPPEHLAADPEIAEQAERVLDYARQHGIPLASPPRESVQPRQPEPTIAAVSTATPVAVELRPTPITPSATAATQPQAEPFQTPPGPEVASPTDQRPPKRRVSPPPLAQKVPAVTRSNPAVLRALINKGR